MIEQLGPYRIDKQIGRGGMGAVYAGTNQETGEKAAIKILAAAFAEDAGFRSRFLTEIETLKQLRHPNIVRLLGDGEQDGQLFYVMELVEGQSLQEELQGGHQYDWQETTEIAIQICQALKHAHDHGVIHRDLKPANLLRAPDNLIKLTDFGIAKLFGGSHLTAAGSVVGTADFMAPEQAEGQGVSNRSDLYSLGTVMFTLLARRPPFGGASLPQVVHKLRYEEAPSIRRFAPKVPAELEQIISQLLSKAPDQRVATALVLANRLRAMRHGLANRDDDSTPAEDFANSPATPSASDEQVTRISSPARSPNTELNPTAVDDFELREDVRSAAVSKSWNEATMETGDEPVGEESSERVNSSRNTIVDTPQPVNRFTTIEADQVRKREETIDKPAKWREAITTIAAAVALVFILGMFFWFMRPQSADGVYSQIIKIKTTAQIEDARKKIDEFIERFPDDPRFAEIRGYQLDIDSRWHASRLRLEGRQNALLQVQVAYVEAMKLREVHPEEARDAFLTLIRDHESDNSEAARQCVHYAIHQLSRLSNTNQAARKNGS